MTPLSLPEDAEIFIPGGEDFDYLHEPAVYALLLAKPDDLASAWDRHHDHRPDYWDALQAASEVIYVGETADVLRRLIQHRNGHKSGVLQQVCEITAIRNIWWMDSKEQAELHESKLALELTQATSDSTYVHQR